ncbi:serine protease HTRA2, mitochondrial-like [Stegodyphus dumicola]|uniref:serine protease HTRA2, mitochondrial-like n=1 Tax=Stegodyphus dumicola TaxID=202533 RepID=UPI0015A7FA10|nr:serine protease HTRA2, mitochondrial-like [Stegodyphus dumicola]
MNIHSYSKRMLHKALFSVLSSKYRRLASYDNRFEKEETKRTNKAKIGLAVGIGLIYYKFLHERTMSLDFSKFLQQFSIQVHAAELFPSDRTEGAKKVTPRGAYNFLADVAEKTSAAVVYIEITARHPVTRKSIPLSNGSGFIVKSDGLILTNAHVVSHYGRVIVKLYNGEEYEGVVENIDTETDLATVRIKAKNLPVLPLGQSSKLRPGEFVIAMGNPLTLSHTITAGVVSSVNRQGKELGLHKKSDYIQTDAAINVGNSGGPLVNLDGEAIGINTMKVTEGISFAIPSDRAIDFLRRTEDKQKESWSPFGKSPAVTIRPKYLGITMLTLTPSIVQELQERNSEFPDVQHGVMVWRVMLGSPSYESGVRPGDVITNINGKEIYSASDIYKLLGSEDILNIHIVRNREEFDITVRLFDPVTS